MKPVIGITPSISTEHRPQRNDDRFTLARGYVEAVLAAGAIPLILPYQDDHAASLLDLIDGLIFSGGADVAPALYGDTEIHPATYGVSPARDRFEIELILAAIQHDLPVLGICRGIQVLNVALGGTLMQDVPDQYGRSLQHRQQEAGIDTADPGHGVALTPAGRLAAIFGAAEIAVNSSHHQAIRDPAPGLSVEARAEDGVIEAVAHPSSSFAMGVQWHPEMMFERHREQLRPFTSLVEAARAHRLIDASA